jgi:FeS assembly SUF system regulator
MFRLNRLTDYAVVVMTQMAQQTEEVRTAPRIAHDTGVPLPTVAKLLNALARGDLVVSHRGAAGGYSLSRSAERITVAEIVQALEGPIALTACVDGTTGNCDVASLCPMRGNWDKVNHAIRDALGQVTLLDMAPCLPFPMPGEPARPAVHNAR